MMETFYSDPNRTIVFAMSIHNNSPIRYTTEYGITIQGIVRFERISPTQYIIHVGDRKVLCIAHN